MRVFLLCAVLFNSICGFSYYAEDFSEAKRLARMIWSDHRVTFYCGCHYDRHGNVDFKSCDYTPKDKHASKRISWEHILPVSWYGNTRPCWKQNRSKRPREVCRQVDPEFRKMEADLHNLVPAIREINTIRRHYGFAELSSGTCIGCQFTVNSGLKLVEPRDEAKGMAARIMLYLSDKYQISMKKTQKDVLLKWNKRFPPDPWEIQWHEKVAVIQGDRNPYIDFYNNAKKQR